MVDAAVSGRNVTVLVLYMLEAIGVSDRVDMVIGAYAGSVEIE